MHRKKNKIKKLQFFF